MVTAQSDSSPVVAVDLEFGKVLKEHGFIQADGVTRDLVKLRETLFEVVKAAKVLTLKERGDKALTRGAIVAQVFPDAVGPEDFHNEDDPELAAEVWRKLDSFLWSELRTGAGSPMQRLVGLNMGNGYVLCRTTVGKDQTSAAYITDNRECLERDFVAPEMVALRRRAEAMSADLEMLVYRQPQHGARWLRSHDANVKAIGAAGHERLTLAIESASADPDAGDAGDGAEPGAVDAA